MLFGFKLCIALASGWSIIAAAGIAFPIVFFQRGAPARELDDCASHEQSIISPSALSESDRIPSSRSRITAAKS
jgi:hypothetical protein